MLKFDLRVTDAFACFRDSAVNWINNIETDKNYKGWPATVNEVKKNPSQS